MAANMYEVLEKYWSSSSFRVCREASDLSETECDVSGGGTGSERVGKRTLGLDNLTDLDLTLLGRNSPNGRRIFEGM